jgi:peptidoglycan/xylan/chitin deacetylase (PgdA/CDA1 family)
MERLSPRDRPLAGEADRPMTWDQARSLARSGFTIGAHSCHHPSLGALTEAQAWQEVAESKALLGAELQAEVIHFSYPHDDGELSSRRPSPVAREATRRAGFASAVSVIPGVNTVGQDVFGLRRLAVRGWDAREFRRQVARAFRYGF